MNLFYLAVIYFSLLMGLLQYSKLDPPLVRHFVWFLLFTAFLETTGYYLARQRINNHWLYNLFTVVQFFSLAFIYYKAIESRPVKKAILVLSGLYLVLCFVRGYLMGGWKTFDEYLFAAGGILTLLWIGLYFMQLVLNPQFPELKKYPMFWISAGLLFYFIGITPFYSMMNFLIVNYGETAREYFFIPQLLIVVKHSLFGVGFLCSSQTTQKYSL